MPDYVIPPHVTLSDLANALGEMHTQRVIIEFFEHIKPLIDETIEYGRGAPKGSGLCVDMADGQPYKAAHVKALEWLEEYFV